MARRNTGRLPLAAIGVAMPPWPGPDEAIRVDGPWTPVLHDAGEWAEALGLDRDR